MKKILCILTALFIVTGAAVFAQDKEHKRTKFALGVYGTVGTERSLIQQTVSLSYLSYTFLTPSEHAAVGGVGLSFKVGRVPIGVKYNFSRPGALALSADYHFIDESPIVGPLFWFLGVGGFLNLYFVDKTDPNPLGSGFNAVTFGARVPVGLQYFPIDQLEVYLAAVPMLRIVPSIQIGIAGELGVRFRF